MGKNKRDMETLARDIERGLSRGLDLFDSIRASSAGKEITQRLQRDPAIRQRLVMEREMDKAHRQALAAHERSMQKYRYRLASTRARGTSFLVTSITLASAGLLDLVMDDILPGDPAQWMLIAGGFGLGSIFAKRKAASLEAEPPPRAIMPPPPPMHLRPGARGHRESEQLAFAEHRLFEIIPAVRRLHPEAGEELAQAAAGVGPLLRSQVERLAVLDRLENEMPGSQAAEAAARGAEVIAARLAQGVDTIDRLLGAAATLLAAPDLGRGVAEILTPAIEGLTAYAHGLAAADLGGLHSQ